MLIFFSPDEMTAFVDHVFQNYPFSILFRRTCHLGRKMIRQNSSRRYGVGLGGKDFRWFFFPFYLFFTYFYILERSTFLSFSFNVCVCVTLCPKTNNTGVNFGQLPRIMQHWANEARAGLNNRAGQGWSHGQGVPWDLSRKTSRPRDFFSPNNFARRFQYWKFFFAPEKSFLIKSRVSCFACCSTNYHLQQKKVSTSCFRVRTFWRLNDTVKKAAWMKYLLDSRGFFLLPFYSSFCCQDSQFGLSVLFVIRWQSYLAIQKARSNRWFGERVGRVKATVLPYFSHLVFNESSLCG